MVLLRAVFEVLASSPFFCGVIYQLRSSQTKAKGHTQQTLTEWSISISLPRFPLPVSRFAFTYHGMDPSNEQSPSPLGLMHLPLHLPLHLHVPASQPGRVQPQFVAPQPPNPIFGLVNCTWNIR